ncbi:MAG: RNA 2',3'-cyclic phosphodiesterase [Tabrizicola sp.]|jgi:2'-5' RNA ligase|nr:RNA 2',3'-cyclic phosphodiesterase [Tabrizicola sp.]
MIRAFLGIDLPPDIRGACQVQQFLLPLPRKVEAEHLHLTLVFLGDCPDPALEAAHEEFQTLSAKPFSLSLEGFGLFGKDKPRAAWAAVVATEPLLHLQTKAETIARRAGCPMVAQKFVPHITLGRFPVPPPPEALRLERAIATTPFRAGPFPVTELTLWQSHLGGKSPRYDVLARYPLA